MDTHTIAVSGISEALLQQLDARAKERGRDRDAYLRGLIERDLAGAATLRELFAPVREDARAAGLDDDAIDALLEEAREEAHRERQASRRG